MPLGRVAAFIPLLLLLAQAQVPVPRLSEPQVAAAKKALSAIENDPRGPYGAIRWYCKDGRVLPPQGTPCGPKAGFQHAEKGPHARTLEQLNIDVARFLAGMPFEQFLDEERNHFWLREMVMLDYLTSRYDGWIYRKTYARRGVRQAEDENAEGRRLLRQLLGDAEWVKTHYLLAMLTVSVTPHGTDTSLARQIRAISAGLADADRRFQNLRGKIHSNPEASDVQRVREFVEKMDPGDTAGFERLISLMEAQYKTPANPPAGSLEEGAQRSVDLRKRMESAGLSGAARLALADEQLRLQEWAYAEASRQQPSGTRRQRLDELANWLRYATGAGYLSFRQLDALEKELARLPVGGEVETSLYHEVASYAEGSLEWARATVMREVQEVEQIFVAIDPHAHELSDTLLRGSVVLPLSQRAERLSRDADESIGRKHRVFEAQGRSGIRALNAGVAFGKLEILDNGEESAEIQPDSIYVIPATLADLKPMKGIITLDSGNALSHAQLLAANLGIPNATIPSSLLPQLLAHKGKEIFFAVTPGGTVILRDWSELSEVQQAQWRKVSAEKTRVRLDTSRVKLDDRRLRTLEEVDSSDSGVIAGPKASNLGQLKRLFPDAVASGVVVPFGIYWQHVSRATEGGRSIADDIRDTFAEGERLRSHGDATELIVNQLSPRLAAIRKAIREMPLEQVFVERLRAMMREQFGADGSYGVFVRSDTNVEDLPQFTGAGLNLTVPNVVGEAAILQAVKNVWASPFEERAYSWRFEALEGTERVYPSIVILRTVQSDKSGVLATMNLATLNPRELTVNVNEGVAAVVDGGIAESLLLEPGGTVKLLAQARSPYRRVANPKGGFRVIPTSGSDYVLTGDEIEKVRKLATDVDRKLTRAKGANGADLPWDIELGFENGELRLFQIRPLVRYQETLTLQALAELEGNGAKPARINLDKWGAE